MSDRIVVGHPDHGVRIAKRAGVCFDPGSMVVIARERDGRLLGGVIFSHFTGESVSIHSAGFDPHWVNRDLLWITFHYPFSQMGVNRIFGQVPADNWRALRFNQNLGFTVVAEIEGVYRGGIACIVMKMEKGACRFLEIKARTVQSNKPVEEATDGR